MWLQDGNFQTMQNMLDLKCKNVWLLYLWTFLKWMNCVLPRSVWSESQFLQGRYKGKVATRESERQSLKESWCTGWWKWDRPVMRCLWRTAKGHFWNYKSLVMISFHFGHSYFWIVGEWLWIEGHYHIELTTYGLSPPSNLIHFHFTVSIKYFFFSKWQKYSRARVASSNVTFYIYVYINIHLKAY